MEDYLSKDYEELFVVVNNKDVLGKITDERESNGEEVGVDKNTDLSDSLLTTNEAHQSIKCLRTFFQIFHPLMMLIFML